MGRRRTNDVFALSQALPHASTAGSVTAVGLLLVAVSALFFGFVTPRHIVEELRTRLRDRERENSQLSEDMMRRIEENAQLRGELAAFRQEIEKLRSEIASLRSELARYRGA